VVKKVYDTHKVMVVGRYFEGLARSLVGGEIAPHDEGDLYLWQDGIGIEVKGSDTNHSFRLPLKQIDRFRSLAGGFPFDHFLYFLFSYRNKPIRTKNSNGATLLANNRKPEEIRAFLSAHIENLFMLDIGLVEALFNICSVSDKDIPLHRGDKSLNVRATLLDRLFSGDNWRSSLGLFGEDWLIKRFKAESKFMVDMFESYEVRFQVVMVGQFDWMEKITGIMRAYRIALE